MKIVIMENASQRIFAKNSDMEMIDKCYKNCVFGKCPLSNKGIKCRYEKWPLCIYMAGKCWYENADKRVHETTYSNVVGRFSVLGRLF